MPLAVKKGELIRVKLLNCERQRIAIAVAHRLSILTGMDPVIVLEHGVDLA